MGEKEEVVVGEWVRLRMHLWVMVSQWWKVKIRNGGQEGGCLEGREFVGNRVLLRRKKGGWRVMRG